MSNTVNPPPHIKIPKEFLDSPALRPYFQQINNLLFQLWKRTGGSTDAVDELQAINTFETTAINAQTAAQLARVDELEAELIGTRFQLMAYLSQLKTTTDELEAMQMNYNAMAARMAALSDRIDDVEVMANVN